jgi:hypothetical protein
LNVDHLFVESFRVDGGPILKRMLPRARGSASPIQKKMSNVTLTLGVNEALKPKYNIVVPKKVKTPRDEEKPAREKREKTPEVAPVDKNRKQGFFKRIFNPGSRASKV